jgi:hypothetical protein
MPQGAIVGDDRMAGEVTALIPARSATARSIRYFAAFALLAAVGCHDPSKVPPPTDPSMLRGIIRVYGIATRDLGRPPQNIDELKAVYAEADDDPSKYVRSNRDGEEFVVVWGLNMESTPPDTVVAYERKGADGKRMVVTANSMVREVSEEEFAKLKFPKNHNPDGA